MQPTQGNGALILLTGKSQANPDLMQKGYIVLRIKTSDAAAIRELVSFLRYGGGPEPFLLGDQKRFVKRAIVAGDANTLGPILLTNTNAESKLLFDGVIVTGSKTLLRAVRRQIDSGEERFDRPRSSNSMDS